MQNELELYKSGKDITVVEAMQKIDKGAKGILFIVDEENRLIGSVTDGDIRRWLLKSADLQGKAIDFMSKVPKYLSAAAASNSEKYMNANTINAVPLVDDKMHLTDIVFRNSQKPVKSVNAGILKDIPVIIMAGGKGARLYPYTKILPKPLIPIGDIPIIVRIMDKFAEFGANDFYITVNYKKGMIKSYFEDMHPDYHITYVEEEKPLGTGGSISLINKKFDTPVIVANCDSLIEADFGDIYVQHKKSGNKITVVSSVKNMVIPYGVLSVKEEGIIESIQEKPSHSYMINTGMYVVDEDMVNMIPRDTFYHMTDLLGDAMKSDMRVGVYPISEDSFLDMGEFAEMKRMEEKLNV